MVGNCQGEGVVATMDGGRESVVSSEEGERCGRRGRGNGGCLLGGIQNDDGDIAVVIVPR